MAFATGDDTKCEVCGAPLVAAWWWADADTDRKVHAWLETPVLGRTIDEARHTPERCKAAAP